jgi:hypothetical protein
LKRPGVGYRIERGTADKHKYSDKKGQVVGRSTTSQNGSKLAGDIK